ncbi:neuroglian-like isoform X2 [Contarinia nasturtii]|uniref:neuroglian-like isoform X2 n=1 Tax=Contarinia nasturtii TaxID=265458 RepID=UPI0012D444B5|nr:neuroglian-like isoform X2 [Contarinia nasturtii]
MPQLEHNAPGFFYLIYRRKEGFKIWKKEVTITNWKQDQYIIKILSDVNYEIKVVAGNDLGESKAEPQVIVGNPGENHATTQPPIQSTTEVISTSPPIPSTTNTPATLHVPPSTTIVTTTPTVETTTQAQTTSSVPETTTNPPLNAPKITDLKCGEKKATISWEQSGNTADIKHYTIEYSTSFEPNVWSVFADKISETSHVVSLSPGATFSFRVIQTYKNGKSSPPSEPSGTCSSKPDIPYTNPTNVNIKGTSPGSFIISWKRMPEIEHHGAGFFYRVSWRKTGSFDWNVQDTVDWKETQIEKHTNKPYQQYETKVIAVNKLGESKAVPQLISGYSGEGRPFFAPNEFKILAIKTMNGNRASVTFTWKQLPIESFNGFASGYKIQIWTQHYTLYDTSNLSPIYGTNETTINLYSNTVYNAHIQAVNKLFLGPTSKIITFMTPPGTPNEVLDLEASSQGSSAVLLKWSKPVKSQYYGQLTGYNIYYEEINGKEQQRIPQINNPNITEAKVSGLKPETTYRFHVAARTDAGEGKDDYVEEKTKKASQPNKPSFWLKPVDPNNGTVQVIWTPQAGGNPGSTFYVKYRVSGTEKFERTDQIVNENFHTIDLIPDTVYDIIIVVLDGRFESVSDTQQYPKAISGPDVETGKEGFVTPKVIAVFIVVIALSALGLIAIFVKCFIFKRYYPDLAV